MVLRAGSDDQAGDGVAAEADERAQDEGFGPIGKTGLMEAGLALPPEVVEGGEEAGRVFFRAEAGGLGRRRASRDLSSMTHSTVSPRENSMA